MIQLDSDYYADGYNLDQIRCWDLSRACACGCYNKEFYYMYCFLYAMHRLCFWKKQDGADDIYARFGLKEEIFTPESDGQMLELLEKSIINGNPVLLILRYDAIFFNSLYHFPTDLQHCLLINGVDKERELVNIKDYLSVKNLARTIAQRKVEIFADFVMKKQHLAEMWKESRDYGVNELRVLRKIGMAQIKNYQDLLQYYLDRAVFSSEIYACYNYIEKLDYTDIRKRLYNSIYMMLDVVKRMVQTRVLVDVSLGEEKIEQDIINILKKRNAATDLFIKDLMKKGAVSENVIGNMLQNDKEIYEFIQVCYNNMEHSKAEQYRNLALNAKVMCDSEGENAPARNAVNGRIDGNEDCWLSDYHYEEHWLIVDLEQTRQVNKILVKHHPSKKNLVTCDFRLEGSNDLKNWELIRSIKNNNKYQTLLCVENCFYRYFRIYIEKANIINEDAARIYGFEIYGEQ